MADRSVRSVAREAGLDEGTLRRTLAGATWPDIRTIALLERALGQPLFRSASEADTKWFIFAHVVQSFDM